MENTITTEKMLYSKDKLISELSAMTVALSQKEKETLDIKPYTEEDHARFTKLNNTNQIDYNGCYILFIKSVTSFSLFFFTPTLSPFA